MLLAREQQIYARYTDALAAVVAKVTRADPSGIAPWVAANAMLGRCRALVTQVRQRVVAGERDRLRLARELRAQARQAAALLERGWVSSAAEEPAPAKVVWVRPELCLAGEHVATGRSAAGVSHPTTSRTSDRRAVPPVSGRPAEGTSACAVWLRKAAAILMRAGRFAYP